MSGDLIPKATLEDLAGNRAEALRLLAAGFDAMKAASAAYRAACVGMPYVQGFDFDELRFIRENETGAKFAAAQRKRIDADMWRALLVNSRLGVLLDAQERRAFEDGLKDPPECTPENIESTMRRLVADGAMIFRRGLVEAFRRLSPEHRSNDGFSIGSRMVVRRVVEITKMTGGIWVRTNSHGEQDVRDVERVLYVLDGQQPPDHLQGIAEALREAIRKIDQKGGGEWIAQTPYLSLRFYRNGNGHLSILRDDLRVKANRLIAEHFGTTLGAGPNVASNRRNG